MGAHKRRKYFFLHCPPPPKLSHHTGNIIGYGPSLPALPAKALFHMPHPGPATELASGLLPKASSSHIPTCASLPGHTTEFLGRKAILPSWRVIPKRTYYLFSPKQTWEVRPLGSRSHEPCKGGSFSASGSYLSFTNLVKMWPDP